MEIEQGKTRMMVVVLVDQQKNRAKSSGEQWQYNDVDSRSARWRCHHEFSKESHKHGNVCDCA